MTVSVKPFGCMPSSGVSDRVQSLITEKYPEAIFLPIETTGDGAFNVQSRIQMMLFKAKLAAQKEFEGALSKKGITAHQIKQIPAHTKFTQSLKTNHHIVACTSVNVVYGMRSLSGFSIRHVMALNRKK
jgi:hypothetical protein